jgi:glycine C-acetyltransferase
MKAAGFNILGHDECPIAPVYIGDAKLATKFSDMMYENGIFVIAFSYPVVPKVSIFIVRIKLELEYN